MWNGRGDAAERFLLINDVISENAENLLLVICYTAPCVSGGTKVRFRSNLMNLNRHFMLEIV